MPDQQLPPAGWYPSTDGGGAQRWWDGSAWTAHTSPQAVNGPHFSSTTVVQFNARKSVGLAFLLTFLFGPFGLFYATITGGVIMLGIEFLLFILGFLTFGAAWFLFFFTWVACIVWGCVAASGSNTRVINTNSRF